MSDKVAGKVPRKVTGRLKARPDRPSPRPRRGPRRLGLSVRTRLIVVALAPLLVVLPLLLGVAVLRWWWKFDALLITKVNGDLTIARQYLNRLLENTGERLAALGASADYARLAALPEGERRPALEAWLAEARAGLNLDYLCLLGPDGEVVAASPPGASPPPGARLALGPGEESAAAIDLFEAPALARIDPALAERARIPLVPTEAAAPSDRDEEGRGMVIHAAAHAPAPAAAPATEAEAEAEPGAFLAGGRLLNRNLAFIDTINDLVYRPASLPAGSEGTATLFLEDVRVSTNVRLFEDVRALGTRVSAEVRARVLGEGQTWRDRAFVVNDWYISAYEPIVGSDGARIGMLYVGFLETPFREAKYATLLAVGLTFVIAAALIAPLFLRWVGRIFRPLERMTATIARVEAGDLGARAGEAGGDDEIVRVSRHLDELLDRVEERDHQLRAWAEELNARVEARTAELSEANRRLDATTQQLVTAEKLAAIGEITAGVAHEINNPVAVIQGNLDVARDLIGPEGDVAAAEFRLIDEQVHRINQIVTKLLQFARPEEYAGEAERIAPADVVADCQLLVQHLMTRAGIVFARRDAATRELAMNRVELQQILINLMTNAVQAMPEGGELSVSTRDATLEDGRPAVEIEVADTGPGLPEALLRRVFDPFFTTKRDAQGPSSGQGQGSGAGQGSGLGLSISQTLASRAGGVIEARNGKTGAIFVIRLPAADEDW